MLDKRRGNSRRVRKEEELGWEEELGRTEEGKVENGLRKWEWENELGRGG